MEDRKKLLIIGSLGSEGSWWLRFFEKRGLHTFGYDTKIPDASAKHLVILVKEADVIVPCVPISVSVEVMRSFRPYLTDKHLVLHMTGLQEMQCGVVMDSMAEIVGFHKMCKPPEGNTLKGENLVVCRARVSKWNTWIDDVVAATKATAIEKDPAAHDKLMAEVQVSQIAMVWTLANSLTTRDVDVAETLQVSTPHWRLIHAQMSRMLSMNPDLYYEMLACNKYANDRISVLYRGLGELFDSLKGKNRARFVETFLKCREHFSTTLDVGAKRFANLQTSMTEEL